MNEAASMKPVKAYISNSNCKTSPKDKTVCVEPYICLYEIEESGKTEERKYS